MKSLLLLAAASGLCAIAAAQPPRPLAIVEQSLPPLDVGVQVRIPVDATGGVPPYHWSVAAGELPEGLTLTPDGLLTGRPTKLGAFAVTIAVEDSGRPAHSIRREFRSLVSASLLLAWLDPPLIHGNQIAGAVEVSNGTKDNFDLTVFIVAVNAIGRATALGYQHLTLKAGSTNFPITFKETLPPGAYVIHADAVAEIPARNTILRQRLQTPFPLPVTQGP